MVCWVGGRVGGVLWEHKGPTFSPSVGGVGGVLVRSGVGGGGDGGVCWLKINFLMKFPVLKKNYRFNAGTKIWTSKQLWCNISFYEHPPTHQTYPKCHLVTKHKLWMAHGVGGGWWWDGWRVHRVGTYTHPPMNSYNVKIFNIMNTYPPTHRTYPKFHSVTIHILWRVHGVGGCVGGGGVVRWRVHGVGAHTHPPMNSCNVKTFHFMNTHPPIIQIQSVTISVHLLTHTWTVMMLQYFILWTPTHPSNISKVSLCHYTYTLDGWWGGWWMAGGLMECVVGGFIGWVHGWWDVWW